MHSAVALNGKREPQMNDKILTDGTEQEHDTGTLREGAEPDGAPRSESKHNPIPRSLQLGFAFLVLFVIAATYWWSQPSVLSEGSHGDATVKAQKPPMEPEQVEGMVKSLQAKLQANPNDAAGWSILARTYSMVGRTADAVDAYARAVSLNAGDAALLVDYADALAVKNGRSLEGEPLKLLNRALDMDPRNIKGLAMAGKYAYDRLDYATAITKWDEVVRLSPPDNLFVQQIAKDLVVAREKTGKLAAEPVRSSTTQKGGIQGVVTLAASLASKVSPEDTVFVTVRGVDGSRLPLAIVRKKVKDLPISFQLGVGPGKVHVIARITKTGNPTPQGGDLIGQLESVEGGSAGLILEINNTFHP